jgi:hypothetical protein
MRRRHRRFTPAGQVLAGLGLAAVLLAGCRAGDGAAGDTARKALTKKAASAPAVTVDPAVTEANRTMASGVPIGTSSAPLEIRFDLAAVPRPGEVFSIDVAALPAAPAPVLRLEVTGGEGLTILEPDGFVSYEKVQAESVTHLKIRASSAAAGTRLVQVRATMELPGGPESRVFAFPVVIGAPAAPIPAPAATKAASR